MSMTPDQEHDRPREQCAGCDATLVADQRYCLRCGARRGGPRIDFTAFWGPLSPTGRQPGPHNSPGAQPAGGGSRLGANGRSRDPQEAHAAGGRSWLGAGAPSRRLTGALAAFVLAGGILGGAALGPTPPSSPADASTLAQRALAALVAQASAGSPARAPTGAQANPTAAPGKSEAANTSAPAHKVKPTPHAASTPSFPGGSSSGEPSSSAPSSEGSSSEGSSSKGSTKGEKAAPGTPIKLPPIKHVWLIALSGETLNAALADPAADPYLAKRLAPKGTLLSDYTLSAGSSLGNGIALLSGQGVNLDTEQNCPNYIELQPPTVSATNGLAEGVGCVYPTAVKTFADELTAAGLTWRAYVQDMEEGAPSAAGNPSSTPGTPSDTSSTDVPSTAASPSGAGSAPGAGTPAAPGSPSNTSPAPSTGAQPAGAIACRHPEPGTADPNHTPLAGDPYLSFRNPFVYFNSLLGSGACASDDVDLGQLQGDLATPADTPSLSWIVPSACDDGSASPCAPGAPAGLSAADAFLKEVVGEILTTAAYREGGLIAIVPDSPPGPGTGSSSGSPAAPASATTPAGALLLSPFVHSGARVSEAFNDFSLLKSLARLFGVLPLGHANDPGAVSFGATVYSTTEKAAQAASRPRRQATPHAGG
jgi:hypothetical protein